MIILATADIHSDTDRLAQLDSWPHDLLLIAGDLINDGDRQEAERMRQWLARRQTPTLIATGNHDLIDGFEDSWLHDIPNPLVKVDTVMRFRGLRMGAVPYLGTDWQDYADCDLLISHMPPAGSAVACEQGRDWGDPELATALQQKVIQPDMLICGHVHSLCPMEKWQRQCDLINISGRVLCVLQIS